MPVPDRTTARVETAVERTTGDDLVASRAREQELVQRIRSGDRLAFDALVLTYYSELRGFLAAFVQSEADAEELVQDIFLTLWRNRAGWVLQSTMRRYLFGAARNVALNHCRRRRVIRRWEAMAVRQDEAPAAGTIRPTDRLAETSEFAAALRRAIDGLPTRCRQVAILRFEQHLSRAEIAEALGIRVKTVERQIARTLRTLRVELAHYLGP
jgi:RNA polymerase sigma-70 factor (ECF subfamily)